MRVSQPRYWYDHLTHPLIYMLLPFSWLFALGVLIRRHLYQWGFLSIKHFSVPVIVVGNMTVGGTGKTPFVIWLAHFLQSQGYTPGIVSRGVGGKRHAKPHRVQSHDAVECVGDEALLLLENTHCPLVIGIDRAAAVDYLLQHTACNIVISDDGLQHYRLGRDMEIVMVDAVRKWGNAHLLPAGPLREPLSRLDAVDMVIMNGLDKEESTFHMTLTPVHCVSMINKQHTLPLSDFIHQHVHAVAGIGNPERFFSLLKQAGLNIISHVFPDHYLYQAQDFNFDSSFPILMTEKDAVKCREFANERYWFLQVKAHVDVKVEQVLIEKLTHIGKRS